MYIYIYIYIYGRGWRRDLSEAGVLSLEVVVRRDVALDHSREVLQRLFQLRIRKMGVAFG